MEGLMNVGSLVLGLIAWILPAVNLVQHNKISSKRYAAFTSNKPQFLRDCTVFAAFLHRSSGKNRRLVCTSGYFPCDGIGCHTASCGYDSSQYHCVARIFWK